MLGFEYRPFSEDEERKILGAIKEAETNTSGEIRLHVCKYCKSDPIFKAKNVFKNLKMEETEARNGVLLFVALEDHKFAILGDIGINEKVGSDFWEVTRDKMTLLFKENKAVEAICEGILSAGEQIKAYFPYTKDDVNELPDEISYGA